MDKEHSCSFRHRTHKALVCKETIETCLEELIDQHIAALHAMADSLTTLR